MKVHPLADKLPLMDAQRFEELCASVRDHGLTHPIVRMDGAILDGRNRQRACDKTGKPAHYVEFKDLRLTCTPEQYIVDSAAMRRDLTADQRAMFILAAQPFLAKQAADRMKAGGERGKEGGRGKKKTLMAKSPEGLSPAESTTRHAIAEQAGVSEHKVRQAEAVAKNAPELSEAVIAGELPLKDAAKAAKAKIPPRKTRRKSSGSPKPGDVDFRLDVAVLRMISGAESILACRDLSPATLLQAINQQKGQEAIDLLREAHGYIAEVLGATRIQGDASGDN